MTSPIGLSTRQWRSSASTHSARAMIAALVGVGMILIGSVTVSVARGSDDREGAAFFESRIRPVLVEQCYKCHSAGSQSAKGGLRLDSMAAMLEGGFTGPAIVPGAPEESVLIEAIRYDFYEMPPSGPLPDAIVADFERWVRMGAPGPIAPAALVPASNAETEDKAVTDSDGESNWEGEPLWSLQPLQDSALPEVSDPTWPRDPVDHHILAGLDRDGLAPAPEVDRQTLIRRLSFDLTGLPPTPEQIEAFVEDPGSTDDALARAVDQFLESPGFGEHWGRRWLDVARYADTNGGDLNLTYHNAWRYRDWVIDAINADLPFDQFLRDQIAGDLVPTENPQEQADRIVATGFLMLGPKMLSERDLEKQKMDVVDEQLDTIGRTFLGLTLGCARCHDHKFDPIPTRDYYAMAGILASTRTIDGNKLNNEFVKGWTTRELPPNPDDEVAQAAHRVEGDRLRDQRAKAETKREGLERQIAEQPLAGIVVDDLDAELVGDWFRSAYSPKYLGEGYIHDEATSKGERIATFRPNLPEPGLYEVRIAYVAGGSRSDAVPVTIETADGPVLLTVDQQQTPEIGGLFRSLGRFRFEAGTAGSLTIRNEGTTGHVLADAVQWVRADQLDSGEVAPDTGLAPRLERLKVDKQIATLTKRIAEHDNGPMPNPRAMAVREEESDALGDCHLRVRGDASRYGDLVPRGFLEAATFDDAPTIPEGHSGRLELAGWMTRPDHPLTSRVIVNRVWLHLFGHGLVRSVDNFGRLGERPSHPKLLDALALGFVNDGWSLKRLVRRLVLSRSYRMSTAFNSQFDTIDPENRLLWRQNRRRLPAEAIRDAMLHVGDRLDPARGGSPVLGAPEEVNGNAAAKLRAPLDRRRSVYLPVVRGAIDPMLEVFDAANPDLVTGRRGQTTVPAQALALLNGPFAIQSAEAVADRVLDESETRDNRIDRLYRLCLGRRPGPEERALLDAFLDDRCGSPTPGDDDSEHRDAWAELAQILFASTEFRFLD